MMGGFHGGLAVKNPANAGDAGAIPGSGTSPWRKKWLPTPVFLPEKSHGQRSLLGYSPWSGEESNMTEQPNTHRYTQWGYKGSRG